MLKCGCGNWWDWDLWSGGAGGEECVLTELNRLLTSTGGGGTVVDLGCRRSLSLGWVGLGWVILLFLKLIYIPLIISKINDNSLI